MGIVLRAAKPDQVCVVSRGLDPAGRPVVCGRKAYVTIGTGETPLCAGCFERYQKDQMSILKQLPDWPVRLRAEHV